jgi:hypothetical protein
LWFFYERDAVCKYFDEAGMSGFRLSDIRKLEKLFAVSAKLRGSSYRMELGSNELGKRLALEIYPNTPIGKQKGDLVSVYTPNAHLQLHFCTGYVISEFLGEVTFIGEHSGKLSGLIIEKEGGCSLFANVDRSLLSGDFTQLGPEVMLSGVALSLTDTILDKPRKSIRKKRAGTRKRAPSR